MTQLACSSGSSCSSLWCFVALLPCVDMLGMKYSSSSMISIDSSSISSSNSGSSSSSTIILFYLIDVIEESARPLLVTILEHWRWIVICVDWYVMSRESPRPHYKTFYLR